jgi:hypothetical protein
VLLVLLLVLRQLAADKLAAAGMLYSTDGLECGRALLKACACVAMDGRIVPCRGARVTHIDLYSCCS